MIDEKKLIEDLRKYADELGTVRGEIELANGVLKAISIVNEQPKVGEWIHFTKRPCDEEEKEMYGWDEMLDCPLPEHEQEILVTDGEYVWIDTFMYDDTEGGCYLDSGNEMIGLAWMLKPEPYSSGD